MTHTLVDAPDVCLTEEEVRFGTTLANCAQSRWRADRSTGIKMHSGGDLGDDIYAQIVPCERVSTEEQLRAALSRAWAAWCWVQHHRGKGLCASHA